MNSCGTELFLLIKGKIMFSDTLTNMFIFTIYNYILQYKIIDAKYIARGNIFKSNFEQKMSVLCSE